MPKREYAQYHVALKILLKKNNKYLFLHSKSGKFDYPGGRIDNVENDVKLIDCLDREIKEELGKELQYKLGKPIFQFRRFFPHKGWKIFLTMYNAEYIAGAIQLSDEHTDYQWIDPKKYVFKKEEFMNEEEYKAFVDYFKSIS